MDTVNLVFFCIYMQFVKTDFLRNCRLFVGKPFLIPGFPAHRLDECFFSSILNVN